MPFDFILPEVSPFAFSEEKKRELDNFVIQLLPSRSGRIASFIPLLTSHTHASLLSFLKTLFQFSDHFPPSEIEALQAQYETFFTDFRQLKTLLEMLIQVRYREAVASHKNKPDTFEKQLAFLREWHKKLNFMARIFLVLRSPR